MVPIPEGSESHSGESESTNYGDSQNVLDQPDLPEETEDVPDRPITGACELSGL